MNQSILISKIDACRRQLETAISLYFGNRDPVSIHTLVAASYNVLRDINTKRGGDPLLMKDGLMARVVPGHEKEVWGLIQEAENFFKHADRDYDKTIEFRPVQTEFLLIESCWTYIKYTGDTPHLLTAYQMWFIAAHQNLFEFSEQEAKSIAACSVDVAKMPRPQYLKEIIPIIHANYT